MIKYLNGVGMPFDSLSDFFSIVASHGGSLPELVQIFGKDETGQSYHMALDVTSIGQRQPNFEEVRIKQFQKLLGEIFIEKGYISQEQLGEVLDEQKRENGAERIGQLLLKRHMVTVEQLSQALNDQLGIKDS